MPKKVVVYIFMILLLLIVVWPNLHTEHITFPSPLRSMEIYSGPNVWVILLNYPVLFHDFFRLEANHIHVFSIMRQRVEPTQAGFKNQGIFFYRSFFIMLFFIFYQIVRTGSNQDDPVLMNGLIKIMN